MSEISNYTVPTERYSYTEQAVKDFRKELHFESSTIRDVAKHSQILEVNPTLPALTTLLGTNKTSSWAKFSPPETYHSQRKKSLYIIPSLGGPDQQDADIQKIKSFLDIVATNKQPLSKLRVLKYKEKKTDLDEEKEDSRNSEDPEENYEEKMIQELHKNSRQMKLVNQGLALIRMLDEGIKSTNVMIDYIISRIFQFVQG